jgi:hypothetical protein
MNVRLYSYIGPKWIAEQLAAHPLGFLIVTPEDVRTWVWQTNQSLTNNMVIATFIVDGLGDLRIADRSSEHFVCAGDQPVQSAGEITFCMGASIEVHEVTNQSTGYCPEPKSWLSVALTLEKIGLNSLTGFTFEFEFRRCVTCQTINLVKEAVFLCDVCGHDLSTSYDL